jgi:hypothetical protein
MGNAVEVWKELKEVGDRNTQYLITKMILEEIESLRIQNDTAPQYEVQSNQGGIKSLQRLIKLISGKE